MFLTFLQSALRMSAVFIYGSTGETLTEKSGNLNLGTPGIMCLGAVGGVMGTAAYIKSLADIADMTWFGVVIVPMLFAMLFAGIGGLIYSFITITLRCNQNVTGLALTTFGVGCLVFFGQRVDATNFATASRFITRSFPFAADLGWFGTVFFSYGVFVYLAIAIAIIVAIFLKKTRTGLNLRAVGENPATADAAGISVTKYKYTATLIGSMITGLGGLFYTMDYRGGMIEYNSVEPLGWLAVALVIFTVWRPNWGILGAILFSMLSIASNYLNVSFANREIVDMVPYLVTVAVLVVTSIVSRRETQPPASLGLTYFREER